MKSNDPTYKISLTVERSDAPGAKLRAVFKDIPQEKAEDPSYLHASAVECFRLLALNDKLAGTGPDPREG
jgi:hypothetical protein